MKTSVHSLQTKAVPYFAALLFLLAASACSRTANFATSSVQPAARGQVKIKKDNNDNYALTVNVRYLAEPERLQPAKQVYVVWSKTPDNRELNLGQLKISHGLFSHTLKGTLEAVSPFKPSQVYITAEDRADIEYPSTYTVLAANASSK
jgi:hypothetical protein